VTTRAPIKAATAPPTGLRPREAFAKFPAEERADRLRHQTRCGDPEAGRTSGLVAYLDGQPVGWCAVEPRGAYEGLVRSARVPWAGREEDKTDAGVWAVTCLLTRVGYRRRGISRALAQAAVDFARERGARAIEACPMTTKDALLRGTACRHPGGLRRGRLRRGEPSDLPAGRHAYRLLKPARRRAERAGEDPRVSPRVRSSSLGQRR
jgi:GNAT superfamily N-acetyltransferase